MTTNIATTKEQSARLLQCGVSADTADMSWVRGAANVSDGNLILHPYRIMQRINWQSIRGRSEIAPAWSLSALIGLLPKEICDENDDSYFFSLAQEYPLNADYRAAYKYYSVDECDYVGRRSSQPIEACVQLIEWLAGNNYKLNKI